MLKSAIKLHMELLYWSEFDNHAIMKISVVICTHNGRPDYFDRCLAALRRQTLAVEEWELLIIDNLSDRPVGSDIDLSWHQSARIVHEPVLGLTFARLRGIRESRADLLVFVDDDNVLNADYLERAMEIAAEYPHLAAWSGSCKGEFEAQPEPWARKYIGPLCVTELDKDYWCNFPFQNRAMPCGAGLCLRMAAARHYLQLHDDGLRPAILDRVGNSLLSGGDIDIALTCAQNGYGMGIFKRLRLIHLMPKIRVQKAYLLRLIEALGFTAAIIEFYHPSPLFPEGSKLKKRIADMLRAMLMSPIDREFFNANRRGQLAGRKAVEQLKKTIISGQPDRAGTLQN
jgi:glycosyltransferase involved in cell wall biosynthesis